MEDHAKTHTLLERAEAFARSRLSKERYEHTLRVADTAEDLALAHDLEADRARLAALLHDAAREIGPEDFLRLGRRMAPSGGRAGTAEPEAAARAGSRRAGKARAWRRRRRGSAGGQGPHDGKPGMGPLALVLYVADKIEPARDYPSVGRLRTLAREDLHAAAMSPCGAPSPTTKSEGRPRILRAWRR